MFAIAGKLGRFSKSEKAYYKERVPYEPSILNIFDETDK